MQLVRNLPSLGKIILPLSPKLSSIKDRFLIRINSATSYLAKLLSYLVLILPGSFFCALGTVTFVYPQHASEMFALALLFTGVLLSLLGYRIVQLRMKFEEMLAVAEKQKALIKEKLAQEALANSKSATNGSFVLLNNSNLGEQLSKIISEALGHKNDLSLDSEEKFDDSFDSVTNVLNSGDADQNSNQKDTSNRRLIKILASELDHQQLSDLFDVEIDRLGLFSNNSQVNIDQASSNAKNQDSAQDKYKKLLQDFAANTLGKKVTVH